MKLQLLDFLEAVKASGKKEIERVELLMFYHMKKEGCDKFDMKKICDILTDAGYSLPNTSRLKAKMISSKIFKYSKKDDNFSFLSIALQKNEKEYNIFLKDDEIIVSNSECIDENKFCGYRGYIDKLIQQVNSAYTSNCYDACAVLLRRIFEILLILSYRYHGIDSQIKNQNNTYFMLERIVANAKNNITLNLSRIKQEYDSFRNLGNFAAHRIEYNTSKNDIDNIKITYRTALEELFYKAGLMK